jgi:hypothetical protein
LIALVSEARFARANVVQDVLIDRRLITPRRADVSNVPFAS